MDKKPNLDAIVSLAKRRGFVFQSSEIYGGLASTYDFGPLGVELKNNLKRAWWRDIVQKRDNVFGFDSAILMHPIVWEASGHTEKFSDPLVECKKCHHRFKAEEIKEKNCPDCGGELTPEQDFNLMLETFLGPVKDKKAKTFLRPETAQGLYVNFKNVLDSQRVKLPFGLAQIGKAFRNEITPKNFIWRMREFEQMEMQFFVAPKEADKWFDFWQAERLNWYFGLGIKKENLRVKKHKKLAHYAKAGVDIEYQTPFGWQEIEGIHNRGDFDLSRHQKFSGKDLRYFDEASKEKFIPFIIETSGGVDRVVLALLLDCYEIISGGRTTTTTSVKEEEIVLRLPKNLAPIQVTVLPLSKKEPLTKITQEIAADLRTYFTIAYDDVASIGRRYRRQDEIGTPFCVTVDFKSLKDKQVTVRDRDTMKQERVLITELKNYLKGMYAEV